MLYEECLIATYTHLFGLCGNALLLGTENRNETILGPVDTCQLNAPTGLTVSQDQYLYIATLTEGNIGSYNFISTSSLYTMKAGSKYIYVATDYQKKTLLNATKVAVCANLYIAASSEGNHRSNNFNSSSSLFAMKMNSNYYLDTGSTYAYMVTSFRDRKTFLNAL